jgi:hypothetical protein
MTQTSLKDVIEGAAAKYLSRVDADLSVSNGHEIGGLPSAGFTSYLGTPGKGDGEELHFSATWTYLQDDEEPISILGDITWYDSRRRKPERSPEYRLYYEDNDAAEKMNSGDFFLIAKLNDGSLLIVITPAGSLCEHELRTLFEIPTQLQSFQNTPLKQKSISFPVRVLLDEIGVNIFESDNENILELLLSKFGEQLPTTAEMSAFARSRVEIDPFHNPDEAILVWMSEEERLFRVYERYVVSKLITEEICHQEVNVDKFINISLSVQNRRKSRAGHAFEHHLAHLFNCHRIQFEKGSAQRATENRSKPDFLFPSFSAYHDNNYDNQQLRMLGAKTSCKDRWRQVLAEADKIEKKHLITLQMAISKLQLREMSNKNLQLVIPSQIIDGYPEDQRKMIISVSDFIEEIKSIPVSS